MAIVYISPTGDDTRSYAQAQSSSTPWKTLSKCQTSATSGDTIIVMSGTHTAGGNSVGNTLTKSFTIQGQVAPTYVNGVKTWTSIFDANNAQWGIGPDGSSVISLTISNIEFRNYKAVYGGSEYTFGIGAGVGSGMVNNLTVSQCKFKTWGTESFYYAGGVFSGPLAAGNAYTWSIHDNHFVDIYASTSGGGGSGSGSEIIAIRTIISGSVVQFYQNTIYLSRTVAAEKLDGLVGVGTGGTGTLTWKNNIIYSSGSLPFNRNASFGTQTVSYNDHYQISSVPSGTGNITTDPLFISATSDCFRLRNNSYDVVSPAIDTGTTSVP